MFPFQVSCVVEMTDSLAKNIKMGLNDFHSHATNTHMFENTFSIEVSDAPEKL
jgi:hypothetical protein